MVWTDLFIFHRCDCCIVNGKQQRFVTGSQLVDIASHIADELLHGRDMQDLEQRFHILLVNLPHERYLRWQGMQLAQVDIGGPISQDKGMVVRRGVGILYWRVIWRVLDI